MIDSLRDPSAAVVMSAIQVLLLHGNSSCIDPILAALLRLKPLDQSQMARYLLGTKNWTWTEAQKKDLENLARANM